MDTKCVCVCVVLKSKKIFDMLKMVPNGLVAMGYYKKIVFILCHHDFSIMSTDWTDCLYRIPNVL